MTINVSELRDRLEMAVAVDAPVKPPRMTVALLDSLYRAHATKEFNSQHGLREVRTIKSAFAPLVLLYGEETPEDITPLRLRAARQYWIDSQIARTTIQARMQRLRKAWRWGRSVGLVTADLPDIGHVRYGHTKEPEPVKPVDLALVERTIPHLSKTAQVLIKLIMYTGMRPGEACAITAADIDQSVQPWVYRPKHHKTAWKGCKREIFIGPRAQMLLNPWMNHAGMAAIAIAEKPSASSADGATFIAPASQRIFSTQQGNPWTSHILFMAVFNACRKHGLPAWSPNQIRHTVATTLRKSHGLDCAQVVLGHSKIGMTQRYAEVNQDSARAAISACG